MVFFHKRNKYFFLIIYLGERVALKKLSRRTSLENETHAMNLNHENVTKIREVFDDIKEDQNSAILVLEYVGQNSLQILIEQQPSKLTPKLTKRYSTAEIYKIITYVSKLKF